MKKRFNLLVTIILMLSLLPSIVPASASENEINVGIEFTDSLFKLTGTADRSKTYPQYMFNALNVPSNKSITIGDSTFLLCGDMSVSDNNDVIKVTAAESADISLSDEGIAVKEIALLCGGYENDVTVDITVNFANGSTKSIEDIAVPAMTKEVAGSSYAMGKCIISKKSGIRQLFEEGTTDVYLTKTVISPESVSNVKSVTLENASGNMFVAAVSALKYSEADLEESIELVIGETLTQYKDKTFLDLNENNISDIDTLVENLKAAKEKELSVATDENIEFANNLKDGYYLYKNALTLKNNIERIEADYFENGEFKTEVEDVDDTDKAISDLSEFAEYVKEYKENAESRTKLLEIAEYFSVSVNVEAREYDSEKVEKYIADLKIKQYTDEADILYGKYKDKVIADIKESDLEELAELLELYNNIEELGGSVSEEEKEYIEYLYTKYDAYQNSETAYTVDISKYFTRDVIGYSGQTIDPETWLTCRDNNNIRGDEVIKQLENGCKYIDEQLVNVENGTAVFYDTGLDIPFYLDENSLNAKVDDIILLGNQSGNAKSITIEPRIKKRTENVYVLLFGTAGTLDTVITYDDNSQSSESIPLNFGRTATQLVNNPYSAGYWYIGGWVKNKLDSSGMVLEKVAGEPHLNVLKIPAQSYKKISKISFSYSSSMQGNINIYALTEMPMTNSSLTENIKALYEQIVSGENIDTSDISKLKKLSAYYNESMERGLKISGTDDEILGKISEMVLDINNEFVRIDKNTVKAEIDFSVPVSETSLKPVITIDGAYAEGAEYALSQDKKKFTAEIPVTKYGGKLIKIELDKSLAIEKYPSIVLDNNYIAEYSLPDYISYEFDEESGKLTLTNNSQVNQDYIVFAGVVNGEEDTLYKSITKIGSLESGKTIDETVDIKNRLNNYILMDNTAKISLYVVDKNLSPLCEISSVKKIEDIPVAGADYKDPVLNLENDRLMINGYSDEGLVNIAVYDENNTLLYAGNRKTEGYFKFDIQLNREEITSSGYLRIELGGDGFSEKYINTGVYFPVMDDRINAVNAIVKAGSKDAIENILEGIAQNLSVNFKAFAELLKTDKKSLSERIYSVKGQFSEINSNDSDEIIAAKLSKAQLIIKQQSVLEAILKKRSDLIINSHSLTYDEIMNYGSIDSKGVTLYSLYNNAVTEEGRDFLHSSLMGNNYKSCEELNAAFAKAIMLSCLKYPIMQGTGYITNALTKENADYIGMNITKYLAMKDKSMINKGIAGLNITSLKDVEEYIKNYNEGSGTSSGNSGSKGTGTISAGAGILTNTEVIENNFNIIKEESIFDDMPKEHWAYNSVYNLYNMGVIAGKGEGLFVPDANITRAEFVKMLCILEGKEPSENTADFNDVPADSWYSGYVYTAYKNGWINGMGNGEFKPNIPISRQDICSIIYRIKAFEKTEVKEFSDSNDIAAYAKEAVEALSGEGIINGFPNGEFKPKENCTRAQAAKLLYDFSR